MRSEQPCSVEDCSNVVGRSGAHGMCGKHYMRTKRNGDPLRSPQLDRQATAQAFCDSLPQVPGARWIALTKGHRALVDEADFVQMCRRNWSIQTTPKGNLYASRYVGGGRANPTMTLMHREIIGAGPNDYVDHRNGDGLDNRRANLRLCRQSQNALNHPGHRKRASRFKGLYRDSTATKWVASFRGKYIGIFDDEEAAAMAYDSAAVSADPEFAFTNFAGDQQCLG